jgi:3-oxoadipate enol-lactonase
MTVEVHFEVSGVDGAPVVVLSNSLGTTLHMWDDQVAVLSEHFQVLRYDQRGHGKSPVPQGPYAVPELGADLLRLLDRLELDRVHYAGLSLGGMTGMWLAAHAPERIDRLALLCTSAYLPPAEGWHDRAKTVRAAGTVAVADASLRRWFTPEWLAAHPDTGAKFHQMISGLAAEGYAGCAEAIATMDERADLAAITAPALVIAGIDDPATPPDHGERIAAGIAGARLEVLDHARHLANVERADTVTSLLLEHFREL